MPVAAPIKERIEGKGRSPPPCSLRTKNGEGCSFASTAKAAGPKTAVEAAVAKPARQRSDEETLLAASAAKAAKGSSWADATDEMADDSQ